VQRKGSLNQLVVTCINSSSPFVQSQRLTPRSTRTQPARSAFPSCHSSFSTSFSIRSQVGLLSFFR
jgi:hypothetical protein